ncbi:hypothetical protein GCM10023184_13520 [Flaviaesturariibacter amylovorans]|uniref:Uncharacterized protein n=1 Tax=Flaviaesturariibacter amylovorans TaxID=1084520 RepID=A0ABP8GJR7_9BACT
MRGCPCILPGNLVTFNYYPLPGCGLRRMAARGTNSRVTGTTLDLSLNDVRPDDWCGGSGKELLPGTAQRQVERAFVPATTRTTTQSLS